MMIVLLYPFYSQNFLFSPQFCLRSAYLYEQDCSKMDKFIIVKARKNKPEFEIPWLDRTCG